HAIPLALAVREAPHAPRRILRCVHVGGTEGGIAAGRRRRDLEIGAESAVVLVVIHLDDDRLVRELGLEVETVRRAARVERAHEGRPSRPVGMDGPDPPEDVASNALRLERAIENSSVAENDRMERARDVEVADLLEVSWILVVADRLVPVVHDEELQRDTRIALRRTKAVAVRREREAPVRE